MQEQQKQQKNPATLGALNQVGSNSSIIINRQVLKNVF